MDILIVQETARATLAGTLSFPEVVARLLAAGVEYYFVDYASRRKIFYSAEGATLTTSIDFDDLPAIGGRFEAGALKAAILDSQRHHQRYRAFSQRAMEAGVCGYFAFLRGQRVLYVGRGGDQHVEWFPGAAPQPGHEKI